MGAVNYLTTMIKLRCPGMTMFRMPLSIWSLFITSLLVLLATPVLASTLMMNLLDHHRFTSFFLPYNHLFSNAIDSNSGGGYVIRFHSVHTSSRSPLGLTRSMTIAGPYRCSSSGVTPRRSRSRPVSLSAYRAAGPLIRKNQNGTSAETSRCASA